VGESADFDIKVYTSGQLIQEVTETVVLPGKVSAGGSVPVPAAPTATVSPSPQPSPMPVLSASELLLKDHAAVLRLKLAGGKNEVTKANYTCSEFEGMAWFSNHENIYVDYGEEQEVGGGDDIIWTCATSDGDFVYRTACPSGSVINQGIAICK
jgi:hypothetical protein